MGIKQKRPKAHFQKIVGISLGLVFSISSILTPFSSLISLTAQPAVYAIDQDQDAVSETEEAALPQPGVIVTKAQGVEVETDASSTGLDGRSDKTIAVQSQSDQSEERVLMTELAGTVPVQRSGSARDEGSPKVPSSEELTRKTSPNASNDLGKGATAPMILQDDENRPNDLESTFTAAEAKDPTKGSTAKIEKTESERSQS